MWSVCVQHCFSCTPFSPTNWPFIYQSEWNWYSCLAHSSDIFTTSPTLFISPDLSSSLTIERVGEMERVGGVEVWNQCDWWDWTACLLDREERIHLAPTSFLHRDISTVCPIFHWWPRPLAQIYWNPTRKIPQSEMYSSSLLHPCSRLSSPDL